MGMWRGRKWFSKRLGKKGREERGKRRSDPIPFLRSGKYKHGISFSGSFPVRIRCLLNNIPPFSLSEHHSIPKQDLKNGKRPTCQIKNRYKEALSLNQDLDNRVNRSYFTSRHDRDNLNSWRNIRLLPFSSRNVDFLVPGLVAWCDDVSVRRDLRFSYELGLDRCDLLYSFVGF